MVPVADKPGADFCEQTWVLLMFCYLAYLFNSNRPTLLVSYPANTGCWIDTVLISKQDWYIGSLVLEW